MNNTTMIRATVDLDPSVPGSRFLDAFRSPYHSSIKSSISSRPKAKQTVAFEVISFGPDHRISEAIEWIRQWKRCAFATPYELLAVDARYEHLQMSYELVTPEFTLGVDPEDLGGPVTREVFGKVIEDTKLNRKVKAQTRYVVRPYTTLVDKIDVNAPEGSTLYEDWLNQYLFRALAPKLSL